MQSHSTKPTAAGVPIFQHSHLGYGSIEFERARFLTAFPRAKGVANGDRETDPKAGEPSPLRKRPDMKAGPGRRKEQIHTPIRRAILPINTLKTQPISAVNQPMEFCGPRQCRTSFSRPSTRVGREAFARFVAVASSAGERFKGLRAFRGRTVPLEAGSAHPTGI